MKIHNLSENNSVLNHFVTELRNVYVQKDKMRFRRNLERIGEIMAYEISKTMEFEAHDIETPLGISSENLVVSQPVVAAILRAAVPFHNGFLNYFDDAESAFISAYRKPFKEDEDIEVEIEYLSGPSIDNKPIILVDPMLATGTSMVLVYKALLFNGEPSQIHIASAVASEQGIDFVKSKFPDNTHIWCAAIDPELDSHSYIVPGIGDAGDLAYGEKL